MKKIRNRKRFRFYDSCDTLPAWRFFEILITNEFRYLLIPEKRAWFIFWSITIPNQIYSRRKQDLPEYFENLLEPVWDEILKEYDRLNQTHIFNQGFLDELDDLEDRNTWIILRSCFNLMLLGQESAFVELKKLGINVSDFSEDSFKKVRSKIGKLNTMMNLKSVGADTSKEERQFIESIVQMSNILKRHIDKDTVTVSEWIYLNKECRKMAKSTEPTAEWD